MLSPAPRTALGLGLFAAALLVVAPSPARAQDAGDISVNPFHHAMDSRGYLTVNASQVLGNKEFAFGLVTDWGYRLVALEGDGGTTFDINHIVTPTLLAAGGAGSWRNRRTACMRSVTRRRSCRRWWTST